jgi:hypothetical protein
MSRCCQDAGQQRLPARPAFGCSPDIAGQVSTQEGESHFQWLACGCSGVAVPGDVLDKPVDDDAAAAAPGERVPGQSADHVGEGDRICGSAGEGFGKLAAVPGEQVKRDRLGREPGAQFQDLDRGRGSALKPVN